MQAFSGYAVRGSSVARARRASGVEMGSWGVNGVDFQLNALPFSTKLSPWELFGILFLTLCGV
jgi:hypothetical protein